jgi:ATP-binding cassette, subfamily B, bacterial CvaB/MchF/RaxB
MLEQLATGFSNRRLPALLQSEAAECGLVCLGMIACFYGDRTDVATLRGQHPISLKGTTLADLIAIADRMHLAARPLKLDVCNVADLKLPCILHWNFDHFVVLKRVARGSVQIHDPACGERRISRSDFSKAFTGVALELWPNPGFRKKNSAPRLSIRTLFGHVTGLHRSMGQVLLLALALEVFSIVSPFYVQWVIDQAIVSADRDLLTTLALGFGIIAIVSVIIGAVRSWVLMHMSTIFGIQWRTNVFGHLLRLPVQYFQKRHLGDITSRFGSIDHIQTTVTSSYIEAIVDGLMSVLMLTMMYIYSVPLGIVASITMILYGIFRWAWYGSLRAATNSQIVLAARQESHFLESVRGIRTLKIFQRENERRSSWISIVVDQVNAGLRTQKMQILYNSINGVLFGIERILIIWLGARAVLAGHFSVGALMAFKLWDDQFARRGAALIDRIFEFRILRLHGERLADIVLSEPERPNTDIQIGDLSQSGRIRVTNLRFRYSEREPFILDGLNFEVDTGECVAIVGSSGCGKSTLVGVLVGILTPSTGDVEINGMSLRNSGPGNLRTSVGSVMQDDVLFAGSIKDNISFFDPNGDLAWIQECARLTAVHEEILAMPMGYNSLIGDMGTVLSGGQKERVLLARALYKRPRILILDEATSHLDVKKEREVTSVVRALQITRIIVAHRPETIASADRVLTLSAGKLSHQPQRIDEQTPLSGHASRHAARAASSPPPPPPTPPSFMIQI